MPDIKKGKDCCGCTACSAVCPKDALAMKPDVLGLKYPDVDLEKCIECGLCEKVCAFTDGYKTPDNYSAPIPYGVRLKDESEVMKSRSGGAFKAFSDGIREKGGVVYGVGFKDHFVVTHKRATNARERDEFRGSKYVQSDQDGIFRIVKADLMQGSWVLFSGTACQVAGLQSYIPAKLKEKLVTVDIVCHGVPSPAIWKDYLEYMEGKEKKIVIGVDFRDKKRFGWNAHRETFTLEDPVSDRISTVSTTGFKYLFNKICRYTLHAQHANTATSEDRATLRWLISGDGRKLTLILMLTTKDYRWYWPILQKERASSSRRKHVLIA